MTLRRYLMDHDISDDDVAFDYLTPADVFDPEEQESEETEQE